MVVSREEIKTLPSSIHPPVHVDDDHGWSAPEKKLTLRRVTLGTLTVRNSRLATYMRVELCQIRITSHFESGHYTTSFNWYAHSVSFETGTSPDHSYCNLKSVHLLIGDDGVKCGAC